MIASGLFAREHCITSFGSQLTAGIEILTCTGFSDIVRCELESRNG